MKMQLTPAMTALDFTTVSLIPIDFTVGVQAMKAITAAEAVQRNSGSAGSIIFAVRRPGCVLCREHGQQLLHLSARDDQPLDGFNLFGVIKESGVDDLGLEEFHSQYFPFPLYLDEDLKLYEAFGNGTILAALPWNPIKIYRGMKDLSNRLKEKKISGNMKGDGYTTGGILILDADGEPKYMYKEETGIPIDEEIFLQALLQVRDEQMSTIVTADL
jgi:hypothetical protein